MSLNHAYDIASTSKTKYTASYVVWFRPDSRLVLHLRSQYSKLYKNVNGKGPNGTHMLIGATSTYNQAMQVVRTLRMGHYETRTNLTLIYAAAPGQDNLNKALLAMHSDPFLNMAGAMLYGERTDGDAKPNKTIVENALTPAMQHKPSEITLGEYEDNITLVLHTPVHAAVMRHHLALLDEKQETLFYSAARAAAKRFDTSLMADHFPGLKRAINDYASEQRGPDIGKILA